MTVSDVSVTGHCATRPVSVVTIVDGHRRCHEVSGHDRYRGVPGVQGYMAYPGYPVQGHMAPQPCPDRVEKGLKQPVLAMLSMILRVLEPRSDLF